MTRIPFWLMVIVAVVPTVLVGNAISAQDKYTVQVPGGLAFSCNPSVKLHILLTGTPDPRR